jgi:hypothetical protein
VIAICHTPWAELLAVIPTFEAGLVRLDAGPRFTVRRSVAERRAATESLLPFFEKAIRQTPALWNEIDHGSRGHGPRLRGRSSGRLRSAAVEFSGGLDAGRKPG